jgi:hypothetical protein
MRPITAIIKILTTIEQASQETLDVLGEGGNPEAEQPEAFFSLNNTLQGGPYCRVIVAPHIAAALQYMLDAGVTSEHVEVIRIEWQGQDMVQTGVDEYGNPIIDYTPFQVGTEDITDEDGNVLSTNPVLLGRMAL